MLKRFKQFRADARGTTAVEFGMIAGLLILTLFGIMEMGRIFWTYNSVQSALELTARRYLVATTMTDSELLTYAQDALDDMQLDGSQLSFTNAGNLHGTTSGVKYLELQGSYIYQPWGALTGIISGLTLTSKVRISHP